MVCFLMCFFVAKRQAVSGGSRPGAEVPLDGVEFDDQDTYGHGLII